MAQSQSFPLFDLPLELRDEIYYHYLDDYQAHDHAGWRAALLRVNKTVRAESIDAFYRRNIWTYQISSHSASFDPLSRECLISRGTDVNVGDKPHLIVEIAAPNRDVMAELVTVVKHVRKLCLHLKEIPYLHKLTIRFTDSISSSWVQYGQLGRPWLHGALCAPGMAHHLMLCFDCLLILQNIGEAKIEVSLKLWSIVRERNFYGKVEEIMMGRRPYNMASKAWTHMDEALAFAELIMRCSDELERARRELVSDCG